VNLKTVFKSVTGRRLLSTIFVGIVLTGFLSIVAIELIVIIIINKFNGNYNEAIARVTVYADYTSQ
jgi:hypothetical protein